jgi:hypothetical protein
VIIAIPILILFFALAMMFASSMPQGTFAP